MPWGHNLVLLDRLDTPEERRWYAAKAIEHNGSRTLVGAAMQLHLLGKAFALP
jgi:predicted nuclease of restriction endonuclease-like (RecB) superfamily